MDIFSSDTQRPTYLLLGLLPNGYYWQLYCHSDQQVVEQVAEIYGEWAPQMHMMVTQFKSEYFTECGMPPRWRHDPSYPMWSGVGLHYFKKQVKKWWTVKTESPDRQQLLKTVHKVLQKFA